MDVYKFRNVIEMRNILMNELNHGYWDGLAWDALLIMARDADCLCIASQVERYINHYSGAVIR